MRSARHHSLTCLVLSSWLTVVGFTSTGHAQEVASDPAPAPSVDPPAAPAPPTAPPSVAPPAEPAPPAGAPLPGPTNEAPAPSQPVPGAPAPGAPAPGATAPGAPAPGATAPSASAPADPGPSPPVPGAPPTGQAAFAPISEPSAKPKARPKADAASSPNSSPLATNDPPPNVVHHQELPEEQDDSDGLLGPFRIGVLVGGGLPEILSLGAQIKLTRFVGAGINIGLIPTVKISYYGEAKLSYQEYDAYGRLYPFGGAFFLGAGVGYATIKGTVNSKLNTDAAQAMYSGAGIPNPILVDSQGSVRTLVLTPQIGFMKIFGSGFCIGLDVGAQLPIAPSKVDFATNTPNLQEPAKTYVQSTYIKPNDDKVRSTLDTIGRTPLPTFNLKIGWFL